jgi:hypothetical protein
MRFPHLPHPGGMRNTITRGCAAAFGALLWAGAASAGDAAQVSLRWSELGPRITGNKVALVLPDGVLVQGKARGVDPAGLLLDISKTSDKRAHPKGLNLVPRPAVSVLRVTEYRIIGRLVFTLGTVAAAGLLVAKGAGDSANSEGPFAILVPAVGAAGTLGLGAAGYHFGKAVDKRVTDIRIAPGD